MKPVKAWAIANVDGSYKNYYDADHPVLYDNKQDAQEHLWDGQKIVRVEIREVKPKKRKVAHVD